MKVNFKNAILLVFALVTLQLNAQTKADSTGFKNAALNYINGWYAGDGAKMQSALHPMLHKLSKNGSALTASALVNLTNQCLGCNAKEKMAQVEILDIKMLGYTDFIHAIVSCESDSYMDYMFITKAYGKYVITHVLWDDKKATGTGTDSAMNVAVGNYIQAISSKDSVSLFASIVDNFSSGQTKCYEVVERIDKKWLMKYFRSFDEGFGKDEIVDVKILANYNGNLGVAIASSGTKTEYIQLAYAGNKWKVYNVSRNYYTFLRGIEIMKSKVNINAKSGSLVSAFDTRLHYEDDIQYYALTTEKSDNNYDNSNFKIVSKKLQLAVDAKDIQQWPQVIRVKAASNFGDVVYQDFSLEKDGALTSAIQNSNNQDFFSVKPNPVKDVIKISSINNLKKVQVFDVQGQVVYMADNISKSSLEINIAAEKPGFYYLVLNDGQNQSRFKIMKN